MLIRAFDQAEKFTVPSEICQDQVTLLGADWLSDTGSYDPGYMIGEDGVFSCGKTSPFPKKDDFCMAAAL